MTEAHSAVIIGLGPKGLYCFERLLAELAARPLPRPVHVHVINRDDKFGASPIYDPCLPAYILLNISIGDIDMWGAEDPPAVVGRKSAFVQWYNDTFEPEVPVTGADYLDRAVVGRYLTEGFRRLRRHLPGGVTLSCHVGEATNIRSVDKRYRIDIDTSDGQRVEVDADKILLALGHSRLELDAEGRGYRAFAERHHSATFIAFAYPVAETLSPIAAGLRIAMKGTGLTFIDAVLELTEGRGGRFERADDGALVYRASGSEPLSIIPFCRTGLPMAPKARDLPIALRALTFFTRAKLRELRHAAPAGQLDFDKELWPLFELEMERAYYQVAMGKGPWWTQLESCGEDGQAARQVISAFLREHPEQRPFDYRSVLDPIGNRSFESGADYTAFIVRYMDREIARAVRGQAGSATKAAIDVWYEVRYALEVALQFGGLTPRSHERLKDHHFPRLKRVVFGPPIINLEKMLALTRAGLIDFGVAIDPQVRLDEASGCFELCCRQIPGGVAKAEVLVDARYPDVNISDDATPLIRNLYCSGMIRLLENEDAADPHVRYRPGAIDMTPESQFVINRDGIANEDIAVIGIPTEGNLVGNKSLTTGGYPGRWAKQTIAQLRGG